MRIPRFLYVLFIVVFFAFALAFMAFQNVGMTHEEGGSRFWLMRIILLLDMVCLVIMILGYSRLIRGVHLTCLLWLLIMPIIMYLNNAPLADTVRTILWPLLFETTYLCCKNDLYRSLTLKKAFIVLAIIGAGYFLMTRMGADRQTNTIYFCFLTLPWLMYGSNKRATLILVFVFTALAMLSFKRSTMLASVMMWGFYFLYGVKNRRQVFYTIILSVVLMVGVYIVYDRIDNMTGGVLTERVNKEETDEGKSREAIWQLTIAMIQNSSPERLLLGHGHFGVRRDSWLEISAHNDFLEVIYDYGLVIFFLYLCLWGYVIKRAYRLYRIRSPLFLPYAAALSIFLVMSMVSHLILYTTYFNYLVMFWGMSEVVIEKEHPEFLKKTKRIAR